MTVLLIHGAKLEVDSQADPQLLGRALAVHVVTHIKDQEAFKVACVCLGFLRSEACLYVAYQLADDLDRGREGDAIAREYLACLSKWAES